MFWLFIALTMAWPGAYAGSLELDDFAYGLELNTDGGGAIYRLLLPEEVYQGVVREDLGDIRVFNGAGQRVPHAVRRQDNRERVTDRISVPFFPIMGRASGEEGERLDVELAHDGAILSIHAQAGGLVVENAEIERYLIDLSGIKRRIDGIEFELTGQGDSFIKTLQLEQSDDLNSWRGLVADATLTRLQYGAHSLEKNRVEIPARHQRYIRFTWKGDTEGIQLQRVHAILSSERVWEERSWSRVSGEVADAKRQIYEFDTGGLYPIDRINLLLPDRNSLIEARLESRAGKEMKWHHRYSGLFYNLEVSGSQIQNNPVAVRPGRDRYWRLQIKTEDGLGLSPPELQFAWLGNELLFLARGEGPFILAYGNGNARPPDKPVDTLLNVLNDDQENSLIGTAVIGGRKELGGVRALSPSIDLDWRVISLWSVLIIGVLVLAFMAYRLFRQLNAG